MSTVVQKFDSDTVFRAAAMDSAASSARRHDLDALRAVAMLLGIVLHAALAFAPIPWTVSDSQQGEAYYVLFACIHGFRMPLFFMLSGFFTAMLWRKRGLASLLKHRFQRILVPLVIGCFTIVPAMWAVTLVAMRPSTAQTTPAQQDLWNAVVAGDVDSVRTVVENNEVNVNAHSSDSGATMLTVAVFLGHDEVVELLIDHGADVNMRNRDQATALHSAVFMGRARSAMMLIEAGADADAPDGMMQTPKDLLKTDYQTVQYIAAQYGGPLEQGEWRSGRAAIAQELGATEFSGSDTDADQSAGLAQLKGLLFYMPAFMHFWFLWFLCWLVGAFVVYTLIARVLPFKKLPMWLICSPASLLWLIPLSMLPQSFMSSGTFGPDPSIGLLPIPAVLGYYAVFFFFGAIYWDQSDTQGQLGQWWFVSLPVALLIVFPVGLDLISGKFGIVPRLADASANALIGNFLQVFFAWLMVFGSIGLFRHLFSLESKWLRYISDSSYWLYLAHLPLVILAQWMIRDLQIPAFVKFSGIIVVVSTILLLSYEYLVRYTLIGRTLNGPRTRPS